VKTLFMERVDAHADRIAQSERQVRKMRTVLGRKLAGENVQPTTEMPGEIACASEAELEELLHIVWDNAAGRYVSDGHRASDLERAAAEMAAQRYTHVAADFYPMRMAAPLGTLAQWLQINHGYWSSPVRTLRFPAGFRSPQDEALWKDSTQRIAA